MEKVSYFNYETLISVLVPKGWEGELVNERQFRLYAPPIASLDDYRSTISYRRTEMDQPGTDYFVAIAKKYAENHKQGLEQFKHIDEEVFTLSSVDSPTIVRTFSWVDESDTGLDFTQFQAFILYRPMTIFIVNGATRTPIADDYLPQLKDILYSTRIIPEPPNWQ